MRTVFDVGIQRSDRRPPPDKCGPASYEDEWYGWRVPSRDAQRVSRSGYGTVLLYINDSELRLFLGLLALAPIMGTVAWLARVSATATHATNHNAPRRRYTKLRAAVKEFIAEVTRLNWAVVEARSGPTNPNEADGRIVAIKERMSELFERVTLAAGVPSPEPAIGAESDAAPHLTWTPQPAVHVDSAR